MSQLPDRLRIRDGVIVMIDGSDATEYLRAWAKRHHIGPDDPMTLMRRKTAQVLVDKAESYDRALDCQFALCA